MSAAVAESPVAVKRNVKTYVARRSELVLTKVPIEVNYGPGGRRMGQTAGEKVRFVDGRLEVPLDEGAHVQMVDGRLLDAAELVEWLDQHPLLDDLQEGFWVLKEGAPQPSPAELEALQELAINHDVEGLEAFVAAERAGWDRADLIAVAEGTIERVHAAQERLVLQQRADAEALGAALGAEQDAAAADDEGK